MADDGGDVIARRIRGVQQPSSGGLCAERREVAVGHHQRPDLLGPAVHHQRQRHPSFGRDDLERICVLLQRRELVERQVAVRTARGRQHDPSEALDAFEDEGMEEQRVDRGKGDRVDADADRERQDREGGEAGTTEEATNGVAEVSAESIHLGRRRILAPRGSRFESEARGPSREVPAPVFRRCEDRRT